MNNNINKTDLLKRLNFIKKYVKCGYKKKHQY